LDAPLQNCLPWFGGDKNVMIEILLKWHVYLAALTDNIGANMEKEMHVLWSFSTF